MITIGYSTKSTKPKFIEHIKETCGINDVQIIEKINNGEKSLSVVYNEILSESLNDIVVLCHDDIIFEKGYWAKRVIEHFTKKPEFGILGVAGTRYYPSSGMWWEISSEMVGQVYHQHNGKKWLSSYNEPFGGKIIDTVIIDGVFMMINKKTIVKPFNESVELPNILENNLPVLNPNKNLPLVSVIMPVHNYGKMFHKSIESVFNSTYKNFELIIVNDGSTDEYVLNKLSSLSNHPNIKIINQENGGPANARNNGIKNSNGVYILPLDSDDMISSEYIQTCVNIIKKDNNISPVYCDTNHIGQMSGIENRPEWTKERLIQGPFIVNCSMFTRESFDICGGYDEEMKGWEDYDLWVRMMNNGFVGKRIPKPLFTYFHHEKDGTVSTEANKNTQELYNYIMNKNNIFKNENTN